MAEEDPAVGGSEVAAVVVELSGRGPPGVGTGDLPFDELRVEAERDEVAADRGGDEPARRHLLAADEGDHRPPGTGDERDGHPQHDLRRSPPGPFDHRDRRQALLRLDVFNRHSVLLIELGALPVTSRSASSQAAGCEPDPESRLGESCVLHRQCTRRCGPDLTPASARDGHGGERAAHTPAIGGGEQVRGIIEA